MYKLRNFVLIFLLLVSQNRTSSQGISTDNPNDKYNPEYHFYPSIDPTGLFYYGGKYFLNWGSATSEDFVNWKMTKFGLERNDQ